MLRLSLDSRARALDVRTPMRYWNSDNFEGLSELASLLRADSRLEPLAQYCELREKGLRLQAFAQIEAFLTTALAWDLTDQRAVTLAVLNAHWTVPQAHQFICQPLRKRLVEPVLDQWRRDEPDNPAPLNELALLRRDRRLLAEAIVRSPREDRLRAALARVLIDFVDYATHHLVENVFIGDEADVTAALAEAKAALDGALDPVPLANLKTKLEELRQLVTDWQEYSAAPSGAFREWCERRNRKHRWWRIDYYAE